MCNEKDKIINIERFKNEKNLIDALKKLSKRQQAISLWLLYHIDILDLIASGRMMKKEEEQEWMETAIEKNDDILIALVQYKRLKDEQEFVEKTKNPLDRG